MTFQCKRCGKRWEVVGFSKKLVVYTLCDKCADEVLNDLALGKTKLTNEKRRQ